MQTSRMGWRRVGEKHRCGDGAPPIGPATERSGQHKRGEASGCWGRGGGAGALDLIVAVGRELRVRPISRGEFAEALRTVRPKTDPATVERYRKWAAEVE